MILSAVSRPYRTQTPCLLNSAEHMPVQHARQIRHTYRRLRIHGLTPTLARWTIIDTYAAAAASLSVSLRIESDSIR